MCLMHPARILRHSEEMFSFLRFSLDVVAFHFMHFQTWDVSRKVNLHSSCFSVVQLLWMDELNPVT